MTSIEEPDLRDALAHFATHHRVTAAVATVQALLKRQGDRYVLRGADRRGTIPRARVIEAVQELVDDARAGAGGELRSAALHRLIQILLGR